AVVGQELLTLMLSEHLGGALQRCAMPTLASNLAAPGLGLRTDVGKVDEGAALPEATLDVGNEPFGVRFIAWMTHAGRIDQEATCLAVLQKPAGDAWFKCIRSGDRSGEVIDDQAFGDAMEEGPRGLEPRDDLLERLMQQWPDERVAAVGQHHRQRPDPLTCAGLGVRQRTQSSEIHLGNLGWC